MKASEALQMCQDALMNSTEGAVYGSDGTHITHEGLDKVIKEQKEKEEWIHSLHCMLFAERDNIIEACNYAKGVLGDNIETHTAIGVLLNTISKELSRITGIYQSIAVKQATYPTHGLYWYDEDGTGMHNNHNMPAEIELPCTWGDYGGSLIDRANYEAIKAMDELPLIEVGYCHNGHALRLKLSDMTEAHHTLVDDIISGLEHYPLIDDDIYYRLEAEIIEEDYQGWIEDEIIEALEMSGLVVEARTVFDTGRMNGECIVESATTVGINVERVVKDFVEGIG